jgi:HSP20 family protein
MPTAITLRPADLQEAVLDIAFSQAILDQVHKTEKEIAQRAYALYEQRGAGDGHAVEDWFHAESELLKPVPVERIETSNEVMVRAEVPGFSSRDLIVEGDANNLLVRGSVENACLECKKAGNRKCVHTSTTRIFRHVSLPVSVTPRGASAKLNNGVLTVSIPKAVSSRWAAEKAV